MALSSPGFKKMAGTVTDVSGGGGGSSAPTADAGSDQTVDSRPTVTLDGSGSTSGATYAWTLASPTGENITSLLSSATAQSPTFVPQSVPGLYAAKLAVTKDGVTSYDSSNVQVGIHDGTWARLVPAQAASTYTSGNYASFSITDDGTWTTVAIGRRSASIVNLTDTEIKWFDTSFSNSKDIQSIEFRILFRPDFEQPDTARQAFVGLAIGASTDPTNANIIHTSFRADAGTPADATRISCRGGGTTSFGWGNSAAGYDTAYGLVRMRMGRGRSIQFIVGKYDSASGNGSNSGTTVYSMNKLWDTSAFKLGMYAGRVVDHDSVETMKFKVSYRINMREGI